MPMQKTFTSFIWAYQNYESRQQENELFVIDKIFEPCELFEKILGKIEQEVPEIQDNVLKEIFQKV
jgi:hypothetical protein